MIIKDGKKVTLPKNLSDAERASVREVLDVPPTKDAPKGMFSLENRAVLSQVKTKR